MVKCDFLIDMERFFKNIRKAILLRLIHNVGLPFLIRFRNPKPWYYSQAQLRTFPAGTFGRELADMLDKNKFELLRNYEHHDAKHVLLGYGMDEEGEVRMQFFFLGNRRYSFPVLSTVAAGIVLMPDKWKIFLKEYRKGRSVAPVAKWDIARMVNEETECVRRKLGICEIRNANIFPDRSADHAAL